MKVITRYSALREFEVEPETALESLLEVGQIIELFMDGEYRDYKIIQKIGNHFIVAE